MYSDDWRGTSYPSSTFGVFTVIGVMFLTLALWFMFMSCSLEEQSESPPVQAISSQVPEGAVYAEPAGPEYLNTTTETLEPPQCDPRIPMYIQACREAGLRWSNEAIVQALTEDITSTGNLTPEQQSIVVLKEMRDYANTFSMVESFGVRYETVTTIAALETGHFTSYVWRAYNNPGGITGRDGKYTTYETPEAGILALGRLLAEEYVDPAGRYAVGEDKTVMGLAKHYNRNSSWVALYVDVRLSQLSRIGALYV